jgi:hypothetical protein
VRALALQESIQLGEPSPHDVTASINLLIWVRVDA